METYRVDGTPERRVVTGMIVSTAFLNRLAPKLEDHRPFPSTWANIVVEQVVAYWKKCGKAPKGNIVGLVGSLESKDYDEKTISMVEQFVRGLSDEYERLRQDINPDYLLDVANEVLNSVKLKGLADGILADVNTGRLDKALGRVGSFNRIELGEQAPARFFGDQDEVIAAFQDSQKAIVEYPGPIGEFFADTLGQDALIAFVAPEKAGKTFWLLDVAFRAASQRQKTMVFEVGDMSKKQLEKRFFARVASHPLYSPSNSWPCRIAYPRNINRPSVEGNPANVEYEEMVFQAPLDGNVSWEAIQRWQRETVKSKRDYILMESYPNSTMTVRGIRSRLEQLDREGFGAKVVVVDYADILAPASGKVDVRDQINAIWKDLRALSQQRHCLVVTATQANAKSYDQRQPLARWNFSEDKRKMAHVNGMVGINVSDAEKEAGVMRLNWIVKREGEYSSRKVVHCATCLPFSDPCVLSCW